MAARSGGLAFGSMLAALRAEERAKSHQPASVESPTSTSSAPAQSSPSRTAIDSEGPLHSPDVMGENGQSGSAKLARGAESAAKVAARGRLDDDAWLGGRSMPGMIHGNEPLPKKCEKYVELLLADECMLMGEPAMFINHVQSHLGYCDAAELEIIAGLLGLAKLSEAGGGGEAVLEALAMRPRTLSLLCCWMAYTPQIVEDHSAYNSSMDDDDEDDVDDQDEVWTAPSEIDFKNPEETDEFRPPITPEQTTSTYALVIGPAVMLCNLVAAPSTKWAAQLSRRLCDSRHFSGCLRRLVLLCRCRFAQIAVTAASALAHLCEAHACAREQLRCLAGEVRASISVLHELMQVTSSGSRLLQLLVEPSEVLPALGFP